MAGFEPAPSEETLAFATGESCELRARPDDPGIRLSPEECTALRSQNVTSNSGRNGFQFLLVRFLLTREANPGKAPALAGRLGRNDQGDLLHLLSRGHVLVAKIRAVRNLERDSTKFGEAAVKGLLALAKAFWI